MRDMQQFQCSDTDALVSYLYDECEPGEREAIDAHLLTCAVCAEEVATLRGTRVQLAAWAPPAVDLGFRVTSAAGPVDATESARVLRPARWWSRPLPAWAQVAAAAVIFSAGIALGRGQSATPSAVAPTQQAATVAPSTADAASAAIAPTDSVSHDELEAAERRLAAHLSTEISKLRDSGSARTVLAASSQPSGADILKQVQAMMAASEQRSQQAIVAQTANLAREFDGRLRVAIGEWQAAAANDQLVNYATTPNTGARLVKMKGTLLR